MKNAWKTILVGLVAVGCDSGMAGLDDTVASDGGTDSAVAVVDSGGKTDGAVVGTDANVADVTPGSDGALSDAKADATDASGCTASSCSGHGTCSASSGAPICTCDAGFGGATCGACAAGFQDKDTNGTCTAACAAITCGGHGTCADTTGTTVCTCDPAYTGASCMGCAAGYQDNDSNMTCAPTCGASTCTGHGACVDTTGTAVCTCTAGYTGAACAQCAAGFQDNDMNATCSPSCNANSCTSHGTCVDTTGTAVCTCSAAYTGAACAGCAAGFQDNDNNGSCNSSCAANTCNSNGTCADTSGTATCTCTAAYTGATCLGCAAGYQDNDNNGSCIPSCAANTCSGNGTCVDSSGAATCTCTGGFIGATCSTLATSCKALLAARPNAASGQYTIDADGAGSAAAFSVYCDMTTDGGGWTIFSSYTGATGEDALTSNTERSGDPLAFAHSNLNRAKKMAIAAIGTETIFVRPAGIWMKMNAPMFDQALATASTHTHSAVTLTFSNAVTASAYMGYANYNNSNGGDFGISLNPDGPTAGGNTSVQGFDHHNTTYYHLNYSCTRQYLYSYANGGNGNAGYDVNTAGGSWTATSGCHAAQGGTLVFYAGIR